MRPDPDLSWRSDLDSSSVLASIDSGTRTNGDCTCPEARLFCFELTPVPLCFECVALFLVGLLGIG